MKKKLSHKQQRLIVDEIVDLLVAGGDDVDKSIERIAKKYGEDNVTQVLQTVSKIVERQDFLPPDPNSQVGQDFPDTVLLAEGIAPACPNDGFPLLMINGNLQCVAELLDGCIGGRLIVDVIQKKKTTYYIFEDGHKLPLLCSCCNTPLQLTDLSKSHQNMHGKYLQEMWMEHQILEDGQEYDELVLGFVEEGQSSGMSVNISFDSVVHLQHPNMSSTKPSHRLIRKKRKKKRRRKR